VQAALLPLALFSQVLCVNGQITNEPTVGDEIDTRAALTTDQFGSLQAHNDGRKSENLTQLIWDDTLAADAQVWANFLAQLGNMQHSTSAQRPNEGENLAWFLYVSSLYHFITSIRYLIMIYSSTEDIQSPMTLGAQAWMNEVSLYHGENIPQGDFSAYGHYSKLLPL
jgi:hypothetical protein